VFLTDELVLSARMLEINVSDVCRQALTAAVAARVEQLRGAVVAAQEAQDLLARLNGGVLALEEDDEE
jgi:hypothetical protein